jgi:hypothetical protein
MVNKPIYQNERSKSMKNKKIWFVIPLISALVLAVAVGVLAFSPSSAAIATQTLPFEESDTDGFQPSKFGFGGRGGLGHRGKPGFGVSFDYDAFIAEELGVSVEKLQAARQAAHEAALEQAVSEGVITAEQAELIKAVHALRQYIDHQEILSQALGIDTAELEAAREEGKSLPYLLGELGIDPEDLRADLQAAYEAAIQQAVDDGIITSSQAEKLQENGLKSRGFGKRGFGFPESGGFQKPLPSTKNDL